MKTAKFMEQTKQIFLFILSVVFVFSFSSCATKVNFLNSSIVPAARGVIIVKKDLNKNYQIKIKMYNLAESNRLSPPRKVYLVWMESGNDRVKNIGQIKSASSFWSKALNADLKTVSSSKPTKIFITAEDDPTIQFPLTQVVLSTNNF
jgi:hypothetical protein